MRFLCPICESAFNHPAESITLKDGGILYRCPFCECLLAKGQFAKLPLFCDTCEQNAGEPGIEIRCDFIGDLQTCPYYNGGKK